MLPEILLHQTRARFPHFEGQIDVTPLEKGGSDRKFYRIATGSGPSLILIKYSDHKEENRHYVDMAHFLTSHGIHVPTIHFHDPVEGLIWMEDLGDIDLWHHRQDDWETRRALYDRALAEAARLHAIPAEEARTLALQPLFDERLYLWEQDYFFDHCLIGHFGFTPERIREIRLPLFHEIAHRLAALPRCLVHRDFQSQNIMIRDGDAWLIDFQGLRPGLAAYDVASLLYDPYVEWAEIDRSVLLQDYLSVANVSADFPETFRLCALQRLMQALGAYGFLGHVKERPHFLTHIPAALTSLRQVAGEIPGLESFAAVLDELR